MNLLDRMTFMINEYDWSKDIGNMLFNQLLSEQLRHMDKREWFKLDDIYKGVVDGRDLDKLHQDGVVESMLQSHPYVEVKKGYVRISKKLYESEYKKGL